MYRATTAAEREEVYRLRYDVYTRELGRVQRHVDHARKRIAEPLDASALLFAASAPGAPAGGGRAVVGTVRVNDARDGGLADCEELYEIGRQTGAQRGNTSVTTKLMVTSA